MAPIFHNGADLSVVTAFIGSKWLLNDHHLPSRINHMVATAKGDVPASQQIPKVRLLNERWWLVFGLFVCFLVVFFFKIRCLEGQRRHGLYSPEPRHP